MKKIVCGLLVLFSQLVSAVELDYYLPQNTTYDEKIPTPESVLGYQVGDWHVRHGLLVNYMYALAEASPRVTVEEIGRSHEQRPLILVKFSSAENTNNLETLRKYHLSGIENGHANSQPLVLWMGYSVHGNEPSGGNASMLVAYYLAAAQGEEIDNLLNNAVIVMEPVINPDGFDRFSNWVNMHKGQTLVADSAHREHVEMWPNGRTNHYWFDLNRDWLLLTHPESRARIKQFHRWKPNLVTDFHEMGTHSTYFFQPGIPSRKNPMTPEKNVELTQNFADFHAKALDEIGSLYFTEESFDDFYAGKGSTYPDLQGSVGILFEQGSSRGHLQESINGDVAFPFTIKNQFVTSLSSFQGALAQKTALLNYQNKFFDSAKSEAKKDPLLGYVLTQEHDKQRFDDLLGLLAQHQIKAYPLTDDLKIDNRTYKQQFSYFVPLQQNQYRLIKSIFSTQKRFPDNTFYDVSSWNLAYAFNIDFAPIKSGLWRKVQHSDRAWTDAKSATQTALKPAYAYAFSWNKYQSPKLLTSLLKQNVQVRFATQAFRASTPLGSQVFDAGSIIIPTGLEQPAELVNILQDSAQQQGVQIQQISSGLTAQGADLGSRKMVPITLPKIMIIGGKGVSPYEAGELWHFLDTRLGLASSVVEQQRVSKVDLNDYTHIMMVNGKYSLDSKTQSKIKDWVKQGGIIIGQKSAAKWLSDKDLLSAEFLSKKDFDAAYDTEGLTYQDRESLAGKKRIAGAVFEYQLDTSHPLTFGYHQKTLAGFKNSNQVMLASPQPFINVALYSKKPLLAGYTSNENTKLIANTAAVIAHKQGKGRVIGFADNLNFRGVWRGTSHLMSNAIFFAPAIEASAN